MNKSLGILGGLCALAVSALGQMTNVGTTEMNSIRLEWAAMPENPYRVFASADLVEPAWSNLTPAGVVFADAQGSYVLPMGVRKGFCFAVASDYIIVDLSEGPTATNYPVSYTNAPPQGGWPDVYKTTMLVLRRIPAGTFPMGSPTNELGRNSDEPQYAVTLTKDYYIGVFETTQKQWERVMGNWPSAFTNGAYRETRPVECVSYGAIRGVEAGTNWPTDGNVDTNSFMGLLRTKTGQVFDLPTEAQWEYACRAGTTTSLNSGTNLTNTTADVHLSGVGRYWSLPGSENQGNSDTSVGSNKVGSYQANPWELYDMHGNVFEFCLDWYGTYSDTVSDPLGAVSGSRRVVRGGAWNTPARFCRSASRFQFDSPNISADFLGFRPIRAFP